MIDPMNFRFAPACFVGNPTHDTAALPVIAKYDDAHLKKFGGVHYIPDCMKDPEWAQCHVFFTVRTASGLREVKVFSQN